MRLPASAATAGSLIAFGVQKQSDLQNLTENFQELLKARNDMDREMIIVLDFGGQYNQLIARRVRECNVYAEVWPYTKSLEEIKAANPKGIIFTGGPNSVYDETSPHYDKAIFDIGVPILGICYGSQLMAWTLGGTVKTAPVSEYGRTQVMLESGGKSDLFRHVSKKTSVWMSHTDYIAEAPEGFVVTSHTKDCPVASMENKERKIYATQFHPEVMHTEEGQTMLRNFVLGICGCKGDWRMDSFVQDKIAEIREKVGDGKVFLLFPAVWILPLRRLCFPRLWASSLPVFSWIRDCFVKTKAMKWKLFSDRREITI